MKIKGSSNTALEKVIYFTTRHPEQREGSSKLFKSNWILRLSPQND